ncbi:hypothetical protein JRQ81_005852 [Phrynocephalus forsythii]|uniref:SCAN domain-containing protein 3 n=1 Tax=Phrynocephalus forsythii TaxID=171643 RepID=A0A9Q0Y388_9SAUR|nr:hypothetical protein JRQ81_005852 [Phrynocephalus forsythii]
MFEDSSFGKGMFNSSKRHCSCSVVDADLSFLPSITHILKASKRRASFDLNKICYFCLPKKKKLTLWKQNIGCNKFSQFSILSELHKSSEIPFDETQVYCQHLESLHKDFSEHFKDILSLEVPQWVMNPFMNTETAEVQIQEELVELSTNETLKASFQKGDRLTEFWLQSNISRLYPGLWTSVNKILIAVPSSYLVERGFSAVTDLIS